MRKIENPVFAINVVGPSDDSNEFLIGNIEGKAAVELGEHVIKETESGFVFDGDVSIEGKIDLGSSDELVTTKDLEGKQDKIDASNKLKSDFVDDSSCDNLFVSATEKSTWDAKSVVTANPSGTDGSDLTRIAINGTNYKIPSGGSGGSIKRACITPLDLYNFNEDEIQPGAEFSITINWPDIIDHLYQAHSEAIYQAFGPVEDGYCLALSIGLYQDETVEGIQGEIHYETDRVDGRWEADLETIQVSFSGGVLGYTNNLLNAVAIIVAQESGSGEPPLIIMLEDGELNQYIGIAE